jgi:glutathionylspermidine synthase
MLLSNKGLLPILWELFPNHELLLESTFECCSKPPRDYVRKPLHSREGANITIVRDGQTIASTGGPYSGPAILQALAPVSSFPDNRQAAATRHPVLGLWIVDQECCGLGIRESSGLITDNLSSFIPHCFQV